MKKHSGREDENETKVSFKKRIEIIYNSFKNTISRSLAIMYKWQYGFHRCTQPLGGQSAVELNALR